MGEGRRTLGSAAVGADDFDVLAATALVAHMGGEYWDKRLKYEK
jgi:hypothetical protein